ncbi:MAG: hypothetical protein SPI87_11855, partial [Anaerobutyricum sp.]|nr:hypothetical protein [Anaerobutyricum sp.]
GGESDNAGSLSGSKIVSGIKKAIGAAALGKAISMSVSEGAELEQSIGGIETLFKGSANKVMKNAADAYKTAGMSANDYMQLTTSFSASLLQSLGNDTSKSADVADMAMRDMSDNANKMGSDMGSITDAYQGFAKQNYTMLDNLKLGYGGTKTEMQRLLADAQKITGVKYDINNLSDVYSAIHVIQGELDITGTTSKEAASTISGSFSSMKASFQNVMGQIALGMDIGPSINALADTTATFLGNLIPAIGNVVTAIPGAVLTFAQAFATQLPTAMSGALSGVTFPSDKVVDNFMSGVQKNLPKVLQSGVNIVTNLSNGILNNLPKVITVGGNIVTSFVSRVLSMLPTVLSSGTKLISNLAKGIVNNLPAIVSAAANAMARFTSSIGAKLPQILESGITILGKLAAGMITGIPKAVGKIPQIVRSIRTAFSQVNWGEIGINIIKGIANGLRNAGGQLWEAVKGILGSFKSRVLSFFGIHSPSTWGIYVGEMVDNGIAKGFLSGISVVNRSVDTLINTMTNPFESGMKLNINGTYTLGTTWNDGIVQKLNAIIGILYAMINSKDEIVINLGQREVARALKEMGVVFV